MKEMGFGMTRIETAFTITADMRDPNVTLAGFSKYKLTRSLACKENLANTVCFWYRDVRISRRGDYEKRL